MSIEVHSGYRPGKPALAVVVSAALLAAVLLAAAWFTRVRNRPILLGQPQPVPGVAGLQIAWPQGYEPVPRSSLGASILAAARAPDGAQSPIESMFLLAETLDDSYVPPEYVALALLESARQQLGLLYIQRGQVLEWASVGDLPAIQVGRFVQYGRQPYWLQLRATGLPSGLAVGVMLLASSPQSPAMERVMDRVAESVQLPLSRQDPQEALAGLGLRVAADLPDPLDGFVHEMPHAGATRVTLLRPDDPDANPPDGYAIDVWTTWLADGRELPDLGATYFRRVQATTEPPPSAGWVGAPEEGVYRVQVMGPETGTPNLLRWLYLRRLGDRRVLWLHATTTPRGAIGGHDVERICRELLASVQPAEPATWDYEQAWEAGGRSLEAVRGAPLARHFQANAGQRALVFTDGLGRITGTGTRVITLEQRNGFQMDEKVEIRDAGRVLEYRSQGGVRPDLAAFWYNDLSRRDSEPRMLLAYRRNGPADPVDVVIQAGRGKGLQGTLAVQEPFVPDPALAAVASHVARAPGPPVLLRTVGFDPGNLESVQLVGLGPQDLDLPGRRVRAFVCAVWPDTLNSPSLWLFDENGLELGVYLEGGATLLVSTDAASP